MTPPSKGMILVVDDDRLVLAMLAHGLSQAGYDVIDADNGDDAILLAREHRPQLALLDIRMQGKSGFDVAAYLREYCRIPFIFLSAFADAQTVAHVKALGALAYLVKPLDVDQILPVVAQAFEDLASRRDEAKTDEPAASLKAAPTPDVLMAVGVLMHRHSLVRADALERLQHLAVAENLTVAEQATRVIEAIERLALPASV